MSSNIDLFFPNFNNKIRNILFDILIFFDVNDEYLSDFKLYFSIFAIPILICHLIVLTRKSMRYTSINVILAALAMSDIVMMFCNCFEYYRYTTTKYLRCENFDGLIIVLMTMIHEVVDSFVIRLSTWLAVGLPFLLDSYYQVWSTPFEIAGAITYTVVIVENDVPDERCNLDSNFTYTSYELGYREWAKSNNFEYFRHYVFIDAIFTKHIPALLSPVSTVILIQEIGRLKKKRNELVGSER
ncbi:unnamed protein product [Caenorhabditis angaria]|uniref:G-protein coupled receptors family 1 profile domain-containing protein n=1 Tax=Caenorhabditis angaria TaxID=860376 RepID=A0A9P1IZ87_9PELO|nr:unnamed protein product [Caenorhabditis angaria]